MHRLSTGKYGVFKQIRQKRKNILYDRRLSGGEGGIRTLDTYLLINSLQDHRVQIVSNVA